MHRKDVPNFIDWKGGSFFGSDSTFRSLAVVSSFLFWYLWKIVVKLKKDETSNWITLLTKKEGTVNGHQTKKYCWRDYIVKYGVSLCSSAYWIFRGIFYNLPSFFLISSRLWSYVSHFVNMTFWIGEMELEIKKG